LFNFTK
jgi:hypothetical protein